MHGCFCTTMAELLSNRESIEHKPKEFTVCPFAERFADPHPVLEHHILEVIQSVHLWAWLLLPNSL